MPKVEEYCEVRAGGGVYRDWMSVAIQYSLGEAEMARHFRLQVAELSDAAHRLMPQDKVDVRLAGQPIVIGGMIETRQAGFDATRRGVQIDGWSHAAAAEAASIDVPGGGQFRDYTLESIANTVLKPLGLKFRLDGSPPGADLKFKNVIVRYGESPIALIRRLCLQRNLRFAADPDGTIIAGRVSEGDATALEEGVNILSANCTLRLPWIQGVVANSQQPGSDEVNGRKSAEISARAEMKNGVTSGTRKVIAEMPLSQPELQQRANMELANLHKGQVNVSVVHKGWLRPGKGGLWQLRKAVNVKSKMLFPITGEADLCVWGVLYAQDAQGGSTTTLDLRNEPAMGAAYDDATKSSGFYDQPSTPARPEEPT